MDVSADGKTLTVTSYGFNSTVQNGFMEYDPVNNPEQILFSFQIKRRPECQRRYVICRFVHAASEMLTDSEDQIFEDKNTADECGAPVGIRTSNLLIRSQMLYPVELRAPKTVFTYENPCKCSSFVSFHHAKIP